MSYKVTIECEHGKAGTHKIFESDFEDSRDGESKAIMSAWLECPICGRVGTEDAQLIRIVGSEDKCLCKHGCGFDLKKDREKNHQANCPFNPANEHCFFCNTTENLKLGRATDANCTYDDIWVCDECSIIYKTCPGCNSYMVDTTCSCEA